MKLAIAGTGMIVREALHGLRQWGWEPAAICSTPRSGAKARDLAERYGCPAVYTDYPAMLREAEADAVYLGVPNALHFTMASQALEAGWDVIVEKPLASNLRQAQALAALARETCASTTARRSGSTRPPATGWRWSSASLHRKSGAATWPVGEGCYIEPPFHANLGGAHVHFGKYVYANFNLTCVDDTHIYVGDCTMFGPNVTLATAGHPILPELREKGYQFNMPIRIGRNCWLGAGVIVLPGVTIGDNVVVGAGSVVTRDLPDNVVAAGTPCRVLREAGGRDREYYYKDRRIVEPV